MNSVPEEIFTAKVAEVDALREYARNLENTLDTVTKWIIALHGPDSLSKISPELKNWTRVITAKSNFGLGHSI